MQHVRRGSESIQTVRPEHESRHVEQQKPIMEPANCSREKKLWVSLQGSHEMRHQANLYIHAASSFPLRICRHFAIKFVCPPTSYANRPSPSKIVVVHGKSWRTSHHHTVIADGSIQLQDSRALLIFLQPRPDVSISVWPYDSVQQRRRGRDIAAQELPCRDCGANDLDGVAEIRIRQWSYQSGSAVHCELEGRGLVGRQATSPCDGLPYVGRECLERGYYNSLL